MACGCCAPFAVPSGNAGLTTDIVAPQTGLTARMSVLCRLRHEGSMITFAVEDLGRDGHHFSVRDQHGRLHVARAIGVLPGLDAGLFGQEAATGMRVLVNEITNVPMQVDFEVIDCSQGVALDLLHPLPDPAVERSAGGLRRAERGDPQAGAHDAVNGSQLL